MQEEKKYLLTIKRNNNDYLPLEWNLFSFYCGENIYDLEAIDNFTKGLSRIDLIQKAVDENILDIREKFESFAIIYYEKGKYRELKEGPIFKEDIQTLLTEEGFIRYIINSADKDTINFIYNLCNQKDSCPKLEEFKFILKNMPLFAKRGKNAILAAASTFKSIPYEFKRKILVKLSKKIMDISPTDAPSKLIYKNFKDDNVGKVA